jgi:hypothetical protein
MLSVEERANQKHKKKELQSKVDLNAEIESIVAESEKITNPSTETLSNHQRVSNIRDNRAAEKSARRDTEAFEIGQVIEGPSEEPLKEEKSQPQAQVKSESLQPNHFDLLRQKREELRRGRHRSR